MTGQAQIIDKAKKLKELAERGIDGEKDTAKRMYGVYKEKHNLTDAQVMGHSYTESFKVDSSNFSNEDFLKTMNDFMKSDSFIRLAEVLSKIFQK